MENNENFKKLKKRKLKNKTFISRLEDEDIFKDLHFNNFLLERSFEKKNLLNSTFNILDKLNKMEDNENNKNIDNIKNEKNAKEKNEIVENENNEDKEKNEINNENNDGGCQKVQEASCPWTRPWTSL